MSARCLGCYQELKSAATEFHAACAQRLFGSRKVPQLDASVDDIEALAREEINRRISITGVQRKLSLDLVTGSRPRLTIVGLWGQYIFKPPAPDYANLPELEDLCMHLARICDIRVATHGLIRLKDGQLGYLCRRFDRVDKQRLAVEDLCQLTGTLTHDKYFGSVEKVGKTIRQYSDSPGFDVQRLFELVVFSFLIGNADMHLKNYAILRDVDGELGLAPAYDLVPTKLLMPDDQEDTALAIQGKKHGLEREDFEGLAKHLQLPKRFFSDLVERWHEKSAAIEELIENSFVPPAYQGMLKQLIVERFKRLQV